LDRQLDEIKKALAERMLIAELDEHLAAESAAARRGAARWLGNL
jgi:hypothetical protein